MEYKNEIVTRGDWHAPRRVLLGTQVKRMEDVFASVRLCVPIPGNDAAWNAFRGAKNAGKVTDEDLADREACYLGGLPIDWRLGHLCTRHYYGVLHPGVRDALAPFCLERTGGMGFEFIPWKDSQLVNLNWHDSTGIASYSAALLDYDAAMEWYKATTGKPYGED